VGCNVSKRRNNAEIPHVLKHNFENFRETLHDDKPTIYGFNSQFVVSLHTLPQVSARRLCGQTFDDRAIRFARITTVRVFLRRQSIYAENSRTRRTTLSEQMSTTTRGIDKAWTQTNGAESQTKTKAVASCASRWHRPPTATVPSLSREAKRCPASQQYFHI